MLYVQSIKIDWKQLFAYVILFIVVVEMMVVLFIWLVSFISILKSFFFLLYTMQKYF